MPKLSRRAVLLVGFLLGLALWLIPALFFGELEPWDGNTPAYPLTLLGCGLLLGFLGAGQLGAAIAGVFVGQLLVLLGRVVTGPGTSELWVVGVMILAGYTFVVTGLGALLGSALRRRLGPDGGSDRRVSDRRT
jgi:hypothetical protein